MPKELPEFDISKFGRFPVGESVADKNRAKTWLERNAVQKGEMSEFVHPIDVWYLNGETSWSPSDMAEGTALYKGAIAGHNQVLKEDERHITFTSLDLSEFQHAIQSAFGYEGYSTRIPELVVLDRSDDATNYALPKEEAPIVYAYRKHYLQPIDEIRSATDRYYKHMIHNGLPEWIFSKNSMIDQALVDNVFLPPIFDSQKPVTEQEAIEHAFYALVDDKEYQDLLQAVRHYIEDDDFSEVEQFLSDERLEKAVVFAQEYDEDDVYNEYSDTDWRIRPREDGATVEDEIAYREKIADLCRQIKTDDLRTYARNEIRQGIDAFKETILKDEDWERWTERVIQPFIASVSQNVSFQRYALEHEADVIPGSLDAVETKKLAILVAQIKDDWQSMAIERTRRFKRQFYENHQAELEERAVKTADTEQELEILNEILERQQLSQESKLRILDVGSGIGRITIPLSEQYEMTGLDANEYFIEEATKRTEGRVTFKKGDVIDYKGAVEHEQYDTVMYTWHSFLEAYGIGNTLKTLTSAWLALKPGGQLIFDMPTRDNPNTPENQKMQEGWYEYHETDGPGYVAYLMDKEELAFSLKLAGFDSESIEIKEWRTSSTELYPEGMIKWTVVAHKLEQIRVDEGEEVQNEST